MEMVIRLVKLNDDQKAQQFVNLYFTDRRWTIEIVVFSVHFKSQK